MMQHRNAALCLIIATLLVGVLAPPPHPALMSACFHRRCDRNSGPVCGIDDTGLPRTFDNRCMAALEYCQYGTYFAELKPGEC